MRSYSNKELTWPSYVELIFVLKKTFREWKRQQFVLLVIGQTNSCVLETKKSIQHKVTKKAKVIQMHCLNKYLTTEKTFWYFVIGLKTLRHFADSRIIQEAVFWTSSWIKGSWLS